MEKGYYLNDYKDGLTYWEVSKINEFGEVVLELREKPAGEVGGKTLCRRRLFYEDDIGQKIFATKEEALKHPERV